MSWIACENCGEFINSDDDPDCFLSPFGIPAIQVVLCERCREELEEEDDVELPSD